MAEPTDLTVPLLREMRAEINARFDRADGRLDVVERRLKSLEDTMQASSRRSFSLPRNA